MLCDTGLMAYLLGVESPADIREHLVGPFVENYAIMEIRKQLGWSETRATLYHFREQTGKEVDLVLENARGQIVAVEIKAAGRVTNADLRHLRYLRNATGDRWVRGVVHYLGTEHVPFDETIEAVPLGALAGSLT